MNKLSYFLIFIFLVQSSFTLNAKENNYAVKNISAELKKNADAVIRNHTTVFELKSIDKASMKVSYAITVLNKNAIDQSHFIEFYDKFSRISSIQATTYNEAGEKLRRIPKDEILDYSAITGYSIYEDNRVKYIDPEVRNVPFTVEYSYEVDLKGLLFLPHWLPNYDFDVSVEHTKFIVTVPNDLSFRYYEQNMQSTVKINEASDIKTYSWEAENLKAIESEPFCLPFTEYAPIVFTAPNDFKLDNYSGNAESWSNFGLWVNELNNGKEILPEETQLYIQNLVKGIEDDEEKVKIIYNYLQENTRYVSIQVGIGGYQPFGADVVDRLKYGDCKALTNYLKALLDAAGVKSIYTLVRAGSSAPRMLKEFPSTQFNHAFLCVPFENDTTWLECTSQHVPCGYLGDFTDDRDVLLITEEGGKVVHTPSYTQKENQQIRTAEVILSNDNNGSAKIKSKYNGKFYSDLLPLLLKDDHDRRKEMFRRIEIPNFDLINYEHTEVREKVPCILETVDIQLKNYSSLMGSRILLPLNLLTKVNLLPRYNDERKSDIFIRREYVKIDTIKYTIPSEYSIEGLPENNNVTSDFGEYRFEVSQEGPDILYTRYLKMNKGTYSKTRYDELYAFFEEIAMLDEAKAALLKKQ